MISLSMIVKNEEKYLRDCLESVKGIVDEIILVDTGSTDNTIKIAKEYGAKVFHFTWINDFSAARNYSLEQCTGDWILYLDADERLAKKSHNQLKKLTAGKNDIAYFCQVVSIDEVNSRPAIMSYVRLFPNNKAHRFEGSIHEQIEFSLTLNNIQIENSPVEILHIGYSLGKDGLKLKAKRNLDILLKEYGKNHSSYYAFQLGQTYGVLENKPEAAKYFTLAVQDNDLKSEYKSTAYRYLAIEFAEKLEWAKAKELIDKSILNDQNQPLALLVAAQIYIKLRAYKEAESFCIRAYDVNFRQLKEGGPSGQVILLSERDILYHCLNISATIQNTGLFNSFYNKLTELDSAGFEDSISSELKFFDMLLNNKEPGKIKPESIAECINSSNMDIFITMLENYRLPEIKAEIYGTITARFPENSVLLNKYGLSLASINNIDKAIEIFEKSFKINPNDPSTVFYLISTYLQKSNFNKIEELIKFAKNKYSSISAVIDKINIIEQRIKAR